MFILSQHIKSIARYIRINCNLVCLFPFRDRSLLKAVFDEYSVLFNGNLEAFLQIMDDIRERNCHESVNIYYDKKQFVIIGWDCEVVCAKPKEQIKVDSKKVEQNIKPNLKTEIPTKKKS